MGYLMKFSLMGWNEPQRHREKSREKSEGGGVGKGLIKRNVKGRAHRAY